jgi:hypothetical protein
MYREGPTSIPANGEAVWWAYLFIPNHAEQSVERNRLIVVQTKFFPDQNCESKEQMQEVTLVEISPKQAP